MQMVLVLLNIIAITSNIQSSVTDSVEDTSQYVELEHYDCFETEYDDHYEEHPEAKFKVVSLYSDYAVSSYTANWYQAVEFCNNLGLRLVITDTKVKEDSVQAAIKNSNIYSSKNTSVWIGASDLADGGNFHWHGTGKRVVYTNWADHQPDNLGGNEHCVEAGLHEHPEIEFQWKWNDRECTEKRYFVCEKY